MIIIYTVNLDDIYYSKKKEKKNHARHGVEERETRVRACKSSGQSLTASACATSVIFII